MPTEYIHQLYVIAPPATAAQLSAAAYALCPDVGPDNVSTELVPADGPDDAEATMLCFSAPVTQQHIDALFGAGLGQTPGILWWRTTRGGVLEKRHDNENPAPVAFAFADAMSEAGVKLRVENEER